MNLQNTEAEIIFKEGYKVDINAIAKSVVDAGFSVRYLKANVHFNQLSITPNYCWIYENNYYQFLKSDNNVLSGIKKITFIGSAFMPKTEYKKWTTSLKEAKGKGCETEKTYYVTL